MGREEEDLVDMGLIFWGRDLFQEMGILGFEKSISLSTYTHAWKKLNNVLAIVETKLRIIIICLGYCMVALISPHFLSVM